MFIDKQFLSVYFSIFIGKNNIIIKLKNNYHLSHNILSLINGKIYSHKRFICKYYHRIR